LIGWGSFREILRSYQDWFRLGEDWQLFSHGAYVSVILAIILRVLSLWSSFRFLNTLDHELMHVLFGYILLASSCSTVFPGLAQAFAPVKSSEIRFLEPADLDQMNNEGGEFSRATTR
jgi:hypothetical protein